MSFLDLPRELRDQIYDSVLVAPDPLLVYCENRYYLDSPSSVIFSDYESESLDAWRRPYRDIPTWLSLAFRNLRLSLGSAQVALEAAEILYSKNTFEFRGSNSWEHLQKFLEAIGSRSRSFLRNIHVQLIEPTSIPIFTDRSTGLPVSQQDMFNFQIPRPQLDENAAEQPIEPQPQKFTYYIDPHIQSCVRYLASAAASIGPPPESQEAFRPQIKLRILLQNGSLPGFESFRTGNFFGITLTPWDTSIPDLIEAECRRSHFESTNYAEDSDEKPSGNPFRALDVVYMGRFLHSWVTPAVLKKMQHAGWEILSLEHDTDHPSKLFAHCTFMLRRISC